GSSINGIPIINNQTFSQTARVKQDQTALVGGLTDREATNILASLPGFGEIPGLAYALQNRNNTRQETEMLILVTPSRLREAARVASSIYAGPNPGAGTSGPAPATTVPQPSPQPTPQPVTPPLNPPNPPPQPPQ